jgi:hypothetical protein
MQICRKSAPNRCNFTKNLHQIDADFWFLACLSQRKAVILPSLILVFNFSPTDGVAQTACIKIRHNYPSKKRENRMEISKTGFGRKYASFENFA